MPEFRITRPQYYDEGTPGYDDPRARQGHYMCAVDLITAVKQAFEAHPERVMLDIEEWPCPRLAGGMTAARRFVRVAHGVLEVAVPLPRRYRIASVNDLGELRLHAAFATTRAAADRLLEMRRVDGTDVPGEFVVVEPLPAVEVAR